MTAVSIAASLRYAVRSKPTRIIPSGSTPFATLAIGLSRREAYSQSRLAYHRRLTYIAHRCIAQQGMTSRELVAASAEPMILALLARGESYGYAIMQEVRKLSSDRIRWTDGMLYPVLHRL